MKPILLLIILMLNTFSLIAEPNEDFIFSASQNNLEGMQEALAKGADINAVDELDCNALMFASMFGYVDIVKFLLANNVKPLTQDISGNTALLYAAQNGFTEIVELLILAGANVNHKDDYDRNALHFAANYGYLDMVKLLVEKGIEIELKNKNDNTPLDLASMNMEIEIVKFLKTVIDNRKFQ